MSLDIFIYSSERKNMTPETLSFAGINKELNQLLRLSAYSLLFSFFVFLFER